MIIFRKSLTDLWNFNGLSFLKMGFRFNPAPDARVDSVFFATNANFFFFLSDNLKIE